MSKQTAVEFLQECLSSHLTHEQQMQFEGLFQQAKEMEKEQEKTFNVFGKTIRIFNENAYIVTISKEPLITPYKQQNIRR